MLCAGCECAVCVDAVVEVDAAGSVAEDVADLFTGLSGFGVGCPCFGVGAAGEVSVLGVGGAFVVVPVDPAWLG